MVLLLLTTHASVIDEPIIQVVVLIIEVVADFRVVIFSQWLLYFFLFIGLTRLDVVTAVFLDRGETILKLETGNHRLNYVLKLESIRAIFIVRRFIEAFEITTVPFS